MLLVVVRLAVEVIETADCGGATLLWRQVLFVTDDQSSNIEKRIKNVISVRGNSKGSHPKTGDDFHFFTLVAVPLCGFHKPAGI